MARGEDLSAADLPQASGHGPAETDPAVPHPARVYDHVLGGTDNFEADRKAAAECQTFHIEIWDSIRDSRAFLGRAVRFLSEAGITQFLDIGTGIPTQGSVHELAPAARVVYVDNDPFVAARARTLLAGVSPGVVYLQADLREPDSILGHPQVRAALDFDRPIALLLMGLLMYIPDSDGPYELVKHLVSALPGGSHLVLNHISSDLMPPVTARFLTDLHREMNAPFTLRTGEEIARFFDGMELVDPGLVKVFRWRPDEHEYRGPSDHTTTYAGVARKFRAGVVK